jgi:hypothetical protein
MSSRQVMPVRSPFRCVASPPSVAGSDGRRIGMANDLEKRKIVLPGRVPHVKNVHTYSIYPVHTYSIHPPASSRYTLVGQPCTFLCCVLLGMSDVWYYKLLWRLNCTIGKPDCDSALVYCLLDH